VRDLATAPVEEVLKLWAGLGYYARARHLHRAAQVIVAEHHGEMPRDADALRSLPGIGRYTAGAIRSIAFNEKAPLLDGNVTRVLCRVFHIDGEVQSAPVQKRLWQLAEDLLPDGQARDFNQALMELGALVCTPADPKCVACPVAVVCAAYQQGHPTLLPRPKPRRATERIEDAAAITWRDGRVLIIQRPLEGLWGGLWEFPRSTRRGREYPADCARRAMMETVGVRVDVGEPLPPIQHGVTHRAITLQAFHCAWREGEPEAIGCTAWAWASPEELAEYAFSAPQAKLVEAVRRGEGASRR
jgi:A/G-specific adenine glycosylase